MEKNSQKVAARSWGAVLGYDLLRSDPAYTGLRAQQLGLRSIGCISGGDSNIE